MKTEWERKGNERIAVAFYFDHRLRTKLRILSFGGERKAKKKTKLIKNKPNNRFLYRFFFVFVLMLYLSGHFALVFCLNKIK